ncbi:MAG: N-formylglutamate amidohydrolase [Gemmatimonadota bacterium]
MTPPAAASPPPELFLTCEHGGNRVPSQLAHHFSSPEAKSALASHRGWDPGALLLARALARHTGAPLLGWTVSRLVADTNRSQGHPRLFSEFTRGLPATARKEILERWWQPHRAAVEGEIRARMRKGGVVLHLGIHTFTPVLDGRTRAVDVGMLYDPSRAGEVGWGLQLVDVLRTGMPQLRIRRNAPYRGISDGLVTYLRRQFPPEGYLALELEVNQAHVRPGAPGGEALRERLAELLGSVLPTPGA